MSIATTRKPISNPAISTLKSRDLVVHVGDNTTAGTDWRLKFLFPSIKAEWKNYSYCRVAAIIHDIVIKIP